MQRQPAAHRARLGPPVLALSLAVLVLLWGPAPARAQVADPSAGWHGRAIQDPQPRPRLDATSWPAGWSAGSVGPGTGYARPDGSQRVREVQRRLGRLGYRPGPVDGLFGPRTRAATRWFQFKHGLKTTGRVDRPVLAVLRARSDHRPLATAPRPEPAEPTPASPAAPDAPASPAPAPAPEDDTGFPIVALLLAALVLGLVAGALAPDLRQRRRKVPAPEPAPAPVRPVTRSKGVLGYAVASEGQTTADTATAAIAVRCSHAGWELTEVIHDEEGLLGLAERPGLAYAIEKLRNGAASGLVVARIADVTPRISDLAALLQSLSRSGAFLAAADHELDTSTHVGRATARAVVELGLWERRRTSWTSHGRFTPREAPSHAELGMQVSAMQERGISRHAIADALNLAGIPSPPGHDHWETADLKEVRRHS